MITTSNLFSVSFLPKSVVIKLHQHRFFRVDFLTTRKSTKIRFNKKSSKPSVVMTPAPKVSNFYINFNNTIQFNALEFFKVKNSIIYLLKAKLR